MVNGGLNERARRIAIHGAETNLELQALAKGGEAIVWQATGADMEDPFLWKVYALGEERPHHDLRGLRLLWDIKNTNTQYLLWARNKNDELVTRKIHGLVMTQTYRLPDRRIAGNICGWVYKERFLLEHETADGKDIGYPLDEGTWFMRQDALIKQYELLQTDIHLLNLRRRYETRPS